MPISGVASASARSSSRGVVHLDQHVHAVSRARSASSAASCASSSAATISRIASAPSARDSATWYSSTMNSLRSAGSAHARARRDEVLGRALEDTAVGQHRQARGAGALVRRGDRRRIEIVAQHALARARLLDLRDHRGVARGDLRAERRGEAARRRRGARLRRRPRRAAARSARRSPPRPSSATIRARMSLRAWRRCDQRCAAPSFCVSATNASSFRFAAPRRDRLRARARCRRRSNRRRRPRRAPCRRSA